MTEAELDEIESDFGSLYRPGSTVHSLISAVRSARAESLALRKAVEAGEAWLKANHEAHNDALTDVFRIIEPTGVRFRREAFRQALARLDWTEGKNGG